jgi:hypothetical protein
MIAWPPEHAEMAKIEAALIRASKAARDLARRHGVPVVVWKDGQVVWEYVEDPPSGTAETTAKLPAPGRPSA